MRRLALGLLIAWTVALGAQADPRLYWEHDGANVTEFTCQIDAGAQASLGLPTPTGTTYSALLSACGTLTAGSHTITVRACNGATCTAGIALTVVKL